MPKRYPRIYVLDGKRISSSDCGGYVHTARKEHTDVLGDPIKKGEKLVRFNNWMMGNEVIPVDRYVIDHDEGDGVILGVRCGKAKVLGGSIKNAVICERFFKSDIMTNTGKEEGH